MFFGCFRRFADVFAMVASHYFGSKTKIAVRSVVQKDGIAMASSHVLCSRTILCMKCLGTRTPFLGSHEPQVKCVCTNSHTQTHRYRHAIQLTRLNALHCSNPSPKVPSAFCVKSWQPHGIHCHPMWSCRS